MMISSWLLTVHALSHSPFHTVSWSLTRWGDENNWWKFLMKIIDENCWWKLLMNMIDQNCWSKLFDGNDWSKWFSGNPAPWYVAVRERKSDRPRARQLPAHHRPQVRDDHFDQSHHCQNIHSQSQNWRISYFWQITHPSLPSLDHLVGCHNLQRIELWVFPL